MSPIFAAAIGYMACGVASLIVVCILLGLLTWTTGLLGAELFKRLRRIYSLFVIGYWLNRLEREGYHTFERAQREGLDAALAARKDTE